MSDSSSYSSSSSSPVVPPAELDTQSILDNISAIATQYASQYYSWGQNVFNNLQSVTNTNMAALTQAADTAMTGANSSLNSFQNSFLPDYNQLRTTAAQYANPARESRNAGQAESGQMQAGNQALDAARQQLEAAGIDVSSGRYADLENAQRTATAAAAAGAGNQSIRADETTALGLQKEALDYGIQMPGIAANFLNQANQARGMAGNLDIGTANAGTALGQLPNAYLATAMGNKYPPIGQSSSSQQHSQSQPASSSGGGNQGNQGSTATGSGSPMGPNTSAMDNYGGMMTGYGGGGAETINVPGNNTDNTIVDQWPTDTGGQGSGYDTPGNPNYIDPYANEFQIPGGDQGGYTDTGQYTGGYTAPAAGGGFNDAGGYTDQGFGGSGGDTSGGGYSDTYYGGDYGGGDTSGDYARGGMIPDQTTGGGVPPTASPSMGQNTDDIHASLNAGEFVIPKDVANWKGQEFFQKLIAQSRKNRATAPAHGKPAAPPTGPVRFQSRPMR